MSDDLQTPPRTSAGPPKSDAVNRFAALTDHMESFLAQQTDRLRTQLSVVEDAYSTQVGLEKLVREFEQQREEWELHRQQKQSRLRQEGTALNDAWSRLEDEQRQLFAERERIRNKGPKATPRPRAAEAKTDHLEDYAAAPSSQSRTQTDTTNWWQLEQLRLEIQKHALAGD